MNETAADKPHKAVMLIVLEVHDVLDTGECSGRLITKEELAQYGLKPKFTRTVNGFDRHECLRKLSAIIGQLETQ